MCEKIKKDLSLRDYLNARCEYLDKEEQCCIELERLNFDYEEGDESKADKLL